MAAFTFSCHGPNLLCPLSDRFRLTCVPRRTNQGLCLSLSNSRKKPYILSRSAISSSRGSAHNEVVRKNPVKPSTPLGFPTSVKGKISLAEAHENYEVDFDEEVLDHMMSTNNIELFHGSPLWHLVRQMENDFPKDIPVIGVYLKGMGLPMSRLDVQGKEISGTGVNSSFAVYQDADCRTTALALAMSYTLDSKQGNLFEVVGKLGMKDAIYGRLVYKNTFLSGYKLKSITNKKKAVLASSMGRIDETDMLKFAVVDPSIVPAGGIDPSKPIVVALLLTYMAQAFERWIRKLLEAHCSQVKHRSAVKKKKRQYSHSGKSKGRMCSATLAELLRQRFQGFFLSLKLSIAIRPGIGGAEKNGAINAAKEEEPILAMPTSCGCRCCHCP